MPEEQPIPKGHHAHTCRQCGHRWVHADTCANDQAAHACKQCGAECWKPDPRPGTVEL